MCTCSCTGGNGCYKHNEVWDHLSVLWVLNTITQTHTSSVCLWYLHVCAHIPVSKCRNNTLCVGRSEDTSGTGAHLPPPLRQDLFVCSSVFQANHPASSRALLSPPPFSPRSSGITEAATTADFTWTLGIWAQVIILCDKHATHWNISPVPKSTIFIKARLSVQ